MKKHQLITICLLLAGMIIFGTATPTSKLISDQLPSYIASFFRLLLSGVVLTPFLIAHRQKIYKMNINDWLLMLAIAVIGTGVFTITLIEGTSRISGVLSGFLMSFVPIITGLGATIFMQARMTFRKMMAFILAVIGVMVVNVGGSEGSISWSVSTVVGVALVLGAVLSEAVFTLSGKELSAHLNPILITGIASWMAVLVFAPFAWWQWGANTLENFSLSGMLALLWWGIGTMAGGTIIWYSGLKRAEALNASVFMAVMPISAITFSYILLGEQFQWIHLVGMGLVGSAILLFQTSQS